ncbi:hypothetical protein [Deinococcus depolymerans]|uniref:M-like protein n=1 Tax=Deinococcus depolymerans TaxID=392408 RepID=A0ABP3LLA8_9DEIO
MADETAGNAPDSLSTPEAAQQHSGSDHATQGANTNLDGTVQGGPATPEDRAATADIQEQHAAQESPDGTAKIKGT